ncbi:MULTISPECIES: hypothetical protein [Cupriavidus]
MEIKYGFLKIITIIVASMWVMAPIPALANTIEVTIKNNSQRVIKKDPSSHIDFPVEIAPGQQIVFTVLGGFSSSNITATYSSGQVAGACTFKASHTENAIGPIYSSSATGSGAVSSSFCYEYMKKVWKKPYDYKVNFMMFQ